MASLVVTILIVLGAMAFGVGFLAAAPEEVEKDTGKRLRDRMAGIVCMLFCGGIGTGGVVLAGAGMEGGPVLETMVGMIVAAAGYGFAWLRYWALTSRE